MGVQRIGRLLAVAALVGMPAGAAAQAGGYLVTLGRDTIAAESFTTAAGVLRGSSVIRTPRTLLREYELTFDADGAPRLYRVVTRVPGGGAVREETYEYSADSVVATIRRDTALRRIAIATKERPLPFSEDVIAPWATTLRRGSHDTLTVLTAARAWRLPFNRRGDTVQVPVVQWGTARFDVDGAGEVTAADLTGTTSGYLIARIPPFDVRTLAGRFAREDTRSGLAKLSPRDTARATIAGARVLLDYGRPSVRGRQIFGAAVVPWEQVWRTGANEATQLITDADLLVGGAAVPAGTYSLWTLPAPDGWKLIINRQHGQWGTQYDSAQDLVRVPLAVTSLSAPVEVLTIRIVSAGPGATLVIDWANTRATAPIRRKS